MNKLIVAIISHESLEIIASILKNERIYFAYSEVKEFSKDVHLYQKDIHKMIKMEIVAKEDDVEKVNDIIMANASCGLAENGCLTVYILDEYVMFPQDKTQA